MADSDVVCIQCAQPIGDPPKLNELEEGQPCPTCMGRLLDQLPPIFHMPVGHPGGVVAQEESGPEEEAGRPTELRLVEDDEDDTRPA